MTTVLTILWDHTLYTEVYANAQIAQDEVVKDLVERMGWDPLEPFDEDKIGEFIGSSGCSYDWNITTVPHHPAVRSFLDVSTAHITPETADSLAIPTEHGGFQPIIEDDPTPHPKDLQAVIDLASELDCDWILFDRDADEVEGLDVYDW